MHMNIIRRVKYAWKSKKRHAIFHKSRSFDTMDLSTLNEIYGRLGWNSSRRKKTAEFHQYCAKPADILLQYFILCGFYFSLFTCVTVCNISHDIEIAKWWYWEWTATAVVCCSHVRLVFWWAVSKSYDIFIQQFAHHVWFYAHAYFIIPSAWRLSKHKDQHERQKMF